jgi:uncharacterized membrane protein YedE/YeeE
MRLLATFVSGLVFGLGLVVSGLINPAKVQAFLDIAGAWDPSLAVTMAVAVGTTALGYRLAFAAGTPALGGSFHLPSQSRIDSRLLVGAAVFGMGWGLVGFCPGPAISALALGSRQTITFVLAMLVGMAIARAVQSRPTAVPLGSKAPGANA